MILLISENINNKIKLIKNQEFLIKSLNLPECGQYVLF